MQIKRFKDILTGKETVQIEFPYPVICRDCMMKWNCCTKDKTECPIDKEEVIGR